MNIADIYAIGCLLVWGVSFGIAVAMLCMGRDKNTEKPGRLLLITICGLTMLILLAVRINEIEYLAWALAAFIFLFVGVGLWTRRYKLMRTAIILTLMGHFTLFIACIGLEHAGFLPVDSVSWRHVATTKVLLFTWKTIASIDQTQYPAGNFQPGHPAWDRDEQAFSVGWNLVWQRQNCWHTTFTRLAEKKPIPLFYFKQGTYADNMEPLQQHLTKYCGDSDKMSIKDLSPEAKP
ncbi:MAG: hypothetical protein V8T90_05025 [Victivallales bacterium]